MPLLYLTIYSDYKVIYEYKVKTISHQIFFGSYVTPSGPITWNHLQNRCVGVQAIAARMGTVEIAPGVEEYEVLDFIPIEAFPIVLTEDETIDVIPVEPAPVPVPIEVVPIAPPVTVPEEILPVEILPVEILPEEILPEEILFEEILPQEIVPEEIPLPEENLPTIQLDKIDKNALLACVIVCFLCKK